MAQAELIYDELTIEPSMDGDLVSACKAGDEAAFRQLYLNHRLDVQRIVYRLLGPNSDLEDVIQEVFIQVYRSIGNFRGSSKFSTWLHRVAVNVALQYLRRKRSTVVSQGDDRLEERRVAEHESPRTPQDNVETNDRVRAIYQALDQLSPKKRAVLVMHDMQGMSAQEVAEIVGAPVFTVRTRLFYARREFYKKIVADPAFSGDISDIELSRQ